MALHQKNAVSIIGSGNWATALGIVVAGNVQNLPDFDPTVYIYVYEEEIAPNYNLSEYMNKKHENLKYLPGVPLPKNLVASPDLTDTVKNANYLIFAIPSFFLVRCCKTIIGHTRQGTSALLLLQSLDRTPGDSFSPLHHFMISLLKIPTAVMCCLNLPFQVACEQNTEITLGCRDPSLAAMWKSLLENSYISVFISTDLPAVELLHVAKDVVGLALGVCDGLKLPENSKILAVRLGILDILTILDRFFPQTKLATVFLPCGIPNIIASSFGNRARRLGKIFVENPNTPLHQLENDYFHGQRVPGPLICRKLYILAKKAKLVNSLRIITSLYQYLKYGDPRNFMDSIESPDQAMSQLSNLKPL